MVAFHFQNEHAEVAAWLMLNSEANCPFFIIVIFFIDMRGSIETLLRVLQSRSADAQ